MIVDLNTRIWLSADQLGPEAARRMRESDPEIHRTLDASPGSHERAMDCVDCALVLGFRSELLNAHIPNEYVAAFVAKDPDRRVGAAGIDPLAPSAFEDLQNAVRLGLSAVVVSPACQGFHPSHSRAMAVYDRCRAFGLPIVVAPILPMPSSAMLEFAAPTLWDEVARTFPDLPILISGLGHPWTEQTLFMLAKHRNVWSDLSGLTARPWQLYGVLQHAASAGVMSKLLFGSGFPHESPAKAIEALYSINALGQGTPLPTIPRAQVRGIVERNGLACLGIEHAPTGARTVAAGESRRAPLPS